MSITQFSIEEVRCFAERQNFEIRPLTFLVGENSTGKTTALGCFQALADYLSLDMRGIDFNRKPYSMGIFRDILRNSRNNEKAFKLGFKFKYGNEDVECTAEFVEKRGEFEPAVKSLTLNFTDGKVVVNVAEKGEELWFKMNLTSFDKKENEYHMTCGSSELGVKSPSLLFAFGHLEEVSEGEKAFNEYLRAKGKSIEENISPGWMRLGSTEVFSTAPIRSRPGRTYDATRVFDDPEGSDVPMQLMLIQSTKKKRWEDLKQELVQFGKGSGMFQNIEVKNLASPGGPFQLRFKVRGPISNIIDVGYGVSQIVPILVQILDPPSSRAPVTEMPFFLLQQPEVHLHPKAQAELSSLLAKLAGQGKRSFLIETHSDYMIDRARIEIRKGTIRPEDVSLIYLEPKGQTVKVHNISFDKTGDMISIPNSYREFFMKEVTHLMGFEG